MASGAGCTAFCRRRRFLGKEHPTPRPLLRACTATASNRAALPPRLEARVNAHVEASPSSARSHGQPPTAINPACHGPPQELVILHFLNHPRRLQLAAVQYGPGFADSARQHTRCQSVRVEARRRQSGPRSPRRRPGRARQTRSAPTHKGTKNGPLTRHSSSKSLGPTWTACAHTSRAKYATACCISRTPYHAATHTATR
jgi:hypothetical protein